MRSKIPSGAAEILRRLQSNGHQAYLVGGCVRDLIMNKMPHDWDICTSALPEETLQVFQNHRVIKTGMQHGTVSVMMDGEMYEVTTFRIDGDYSDGRHPDSVSFTQNLVEDLSRRDFTVNAIAMTVGGELIDPFDGKSDIADGIIRCVGDPYARFQEDGLRIMRAIRFAVTLDFNCIEEETQDAMHECRECLRNVSDERIMAEIKKLLVGRGPGMKLYHFADILSVFWPEIGECVGFKQYNKYHLYDVWTHIIVALDSAATDDLIVRLALLLHDIAKPRCFTLDDEGHGHFYGHPPVCAVMADDMLRRLKFDNATRESVVKLIEYHDATISATERSVKRWLNKIGETQFRRLLFIKTADALAHNPEYIGNKIDVVHKTSEILNDVLAQQQCFTMRDLEIDGYDVIYFGFEEGPEIGAVLKEILNRVIDGELENSRPRLLRALIDIADNRR